MEKSYYICLAVLIVLSVWDICQRSLPTNILLLLIMVVLFYQVVGAHKNIWLIVLGGITGILFLLISKVTREAIGYGDSLGVLCLGLLLGFWDLLAVLSVAFFLLALVSGGLLWGKKISGKSGIPFYPFLAAGMAWWVMIA